MIIMNILLLTPIMMELLAKLRISATALAYQGLTIQRENT